MNAAVIQQTYPEASIIPAEVVQAARQEAVRNQRRLLEVLEERLGLPPEAFLRQLGSTFRWPVLCMDDLHALTPAFDLLPYTEALQRECLALRYGEDLLLVLSDPFSPDLLLWAEAFMGRAFVPHLAHSRDIAAYLARHEETLRALDSVLAPGSGNAQSAVEDLSLKAISGDSSPVVRLVHSTLYDALRAGASDIHFETGPSALVIKYRIDGVLTPVGNRQGLDIAEQVISRIKVMSELDIAERRIPQDGRFKVSVRGREVDFRVSIMPSLFGEDAVLRILDKQSLSEQMKELRLDHLGFDAPSILQLRHLANEPYGMVLVTGPTGSGKTTTLYAAISEINHGQDKIVTIEDPVEYQLPGILQIPVNEKKGLTFARGLRSILRHDPDKILVGEIRDPETAQIAVQSALTGHLVFTTVHANNVFDVIGRFTHMGVDPYSFVSALNGIVAQRLLRVVCPHCAAPEQPDSQLLADAGLHPEAIGSHQFRSGRGCGHCRGTGYKGRRAIAEILLLNDEIREAIIQRASIRRLKELAQQHGTRFLRAAALDLVCQGQTTLQEANRVTLAT